MALLVSSFISHDVFITEEAPASIKLRARLISPSPEYNAPMPELHALRTTIGELTWSD